MNTKTIIKEVLLAFIALVWVFTGVLKIFDFANFQNQLQGGYITSYFGSSLAYILITTQLLCAVLLLNTKSRKVGIIISTLLATVYFGYVLYILNWAPSKPCSCISMVRGMNWNQQLYFNIFFVIINFISLLLIFRNSRYTVLPESTEPV